MPFVQITVIEGQSADCLDALSQAVHQALMDEFGIPELDKFQVIHEVSEGHLIFPYEYLGIPHTKAMVYIQITAKQGRTVSMKQKLYAKIASLIHANTSIAKEDVFIVLTENAEENWLVR